MHNFQIALNIVDIAIAEARKAQSENIREVEIGNWHGFRSEREALEFALESAVKGTILENTSILIHEIQAIAECNACKHKFNSDGIVAICPECGDITANLVSGRETESQIYYT